MLISRLAHPVQNLGHGQRAVIWTQGCSLRCAGCMSVDTWAFRQDRDLLPEQIAAWLLDIPGRIDGVTVSGGEPTEQPELPGLLAMLRHLGHIRREEWDLLVFTGRETAEVKADHPWLTELADAVVTGPYVEELAGDHVLRGSANQELLLCSPLGRQRYREPHGARPPLDVYVSDGKLVLTGIPRPGELDALAAALARDGVRLRNTSWRGA